MVSSKSSDTDQFPEQPALRRLRYLVTALILVLIVGVLTVVGTLVIKIGEVTGGGPRPVAAASLTLPPGERITAVGEAAGSILLVTRDAAGAERLRKFDRETGRPLSETAITREP